MAKFKDAVFAIALEVGSDACQWIRKLCVFYYPFFFCCGCFISLIYYLAQKAKCIHSPFSIGSWQLGFLSCNVKNNCEFYNSKLFHFHSYTVLRLVSKDCLSFLLLFELLNSDSFLFSFSFLKLKETSRCLSAIIRL